MLGFLSDDFGNQGGSTGQIGSCNSQYGITYTQFAIDHVVPQGSTPPEPVFAWLESQPNPGPDTSALPSWNFSKYLVSRTGTLIAHWDSPVYPGKDPNDPNSTFDNSAVVIAIRAELAK